jgi:hypothetical protein
VFSIGQIQEKYAQEKVFSLVFKENQQFSPEEQVLFEYFKENQPF